MEAVAYSTFRNNMKSYMRKTREDADSLLITNVDPEDNVVVMSASSYDSLMETLRIYANRPLHEKILKGMEQAQAGATSERDLVDDDD